MARWYATAKESPLFLLAFLLSPWASRALLLHDKQLLLQSSDLRGALSDLALTSLVVLLAWATLRLARVISFVLLGIWLLINHINTEHVAALDSIMDPKNIRYLLSDTFLGGSGAALSHPLLSIGLALGSLLLLWLSVRTRPLLPALLLMISLGATLLWPLNSERFSWRQAHSLQLLGERLFRPAPDLELGHHTPPDLAGSPLFERRVKRPNVLLIMLEGISGAYVPTLARRHGIQYELTMSELDRIASRGLSYASFIAQQRQTNRGEYALLCGDPPKLTSSDAKMTEYLKGGRRRCLPAVLKANGYRTIYMQSAPLSFMLKDQFMPRIGFEEVLGDRSLEDGYVRDNWGIDDRSLFEQAHRKILRLQRDAAPWFLTLLTVGTHHPFGLVPAAFTPTITDKHARAVAYLDQALGEFFRRLDRTAVGRDTLILITSDESAGITQGFDDLTRQLSQNWGLLVVLTPEKIRRIRDATFLQSDLAISTLDYLGLASQGWHMTGRSFFRDYPTTRLLVFANTYTKKISALDGGDRLISCSDQLSHCSSYRVKRGRLFGTARTPLPGSTPGVLRVLANQLPRRGPTRRSHYNLIASPVVKLHQRKKAQTIFAGQHLYLKAGAQITVDLKLSIKGEGGPVQLFHDLRSWGSKGAALTHYKAPPTRLKGGENLELKYSFRTDVPLTPMSCRLFARQRGEGDLELVLSRATLEILEEPPPDTPHAPWTKRHHRKIYRTGQ